MAIVEGQKIRMLWRYSDSDYYLGLGYPKLKKDEEFFVSVNDLKGSSKKQVELRCDECGDYFYQSFTLTRTRDRKHFCSEGCNNIHYLELDNFLLESLKSYTIDNHRSPKWIDFYHSDIFPDPQLYLIRFEKWNKALRKAGLSKIYQKDITKQELIKEGRVFFEEYNRSPSYKELSYDVHIISKMFNGWNNFLDACNIPHIQRDRLKWDKDYGIKNILDFHNKNNRIPSSTDLEAYGMHKDWLIGTFGSVQNALIDSGICTEADFPDKEERIKNSLNFIKDFYKDQHRPPTVAEYNYVAKQSNKIIWRRNLSEILGKKFSEICVSIINEDISYNDLGIGRYSIDKNGEFCRSYKEKMISNLLIDNNINFEKEVKYSEVNPSISEGYIMDWYLKDSNIFVELFGMYQDNYTPKDKIGYEYMIKTESKMDVCRNNNVRLISIFKRDKPSDIIGKFKEFNIDIELTDEFKLL